MRRIFSFLSFSFALLGLPAIALSAPLNARFSATEPGSEEITAPSQEDEETPPLKEVSRPGTAFDVIPAAHRSNIIRRIRLTEKLAQEHGRAYDYRVLSIADLEGILKDLEAKRGR